MTLNLFDNFLPVIFLWRKCQERKIKGVSRDWRVSDLEEKWALQACGGNRRSWVRQRGDDTECFAWEKTAIKIFVHYSRYFLQNQKQGPQFWALSNEFVRCTGKVRVLHLKKLIHTQEDNLLLSIAAAVAGTFCRDKKKISFFFC